MTPVAGSTALPAGTLVRLASGWQMPIEELAAGAVLDSGAVVVSVAALLRGAVPDAVSLAAGALTQGAPAADLVLSPLQWIVFADRVAPAGAPDDGAPDDGAPAGAPGDVAPAGALANGITIRRLSTAPLDWYALAVDRASTLTAAGVSLPLPGPAGLAAHLRPLAAGPALEALRARLCPPAPPSLRLMLGTQELPLAVASDRLEAMLPAGNEATATVLQLISPPGRPRGTADLRRFGIAIRAVELDGAALALDDPGFGDGFYPVERRDDVSWRWTNGNARLSLPASAFPRALVLHLTSWHTHLEPA